LIRTTLVLPALAVLVLTGCESTQDKSARLRKDAKFALKQSVRLVDHQTGLVAITSDAVLATKDRGAVVVTVRNKENRPLARLPIGISVLDRNGQKLFTNEVPGMQQSLIEIPVLAPGQSLSWVNDQLNIGGTHPGRVKAIVGDPKKRPVSVPKLAVSAPKLVIDPVSGVESVGQVSNASKITQLNLVVFGVARKGGKVVAAGRALVPKLDAGKSAKFSIFWVGNPKGAQVEVSAPPTVLG
jgi:hypothetical protein